MPMIEKDERRAPPAASTPAGRALADCAPVARPPVARTLVARMEERFAVPFKSDAFAHRTWFLVTLVAIVALYAAVLAYLLVRDHAEPLSPPQEETPVEVVVEPPKPPQQPQQQAEAKPPEPEKPASSAPREANDEKVETDKTQKDTHAPKAPAPPADGHPEAAAQASAPSDAPAEPAKPDEAAAKPEAPDKDAEALDRAVPLPPKRPDLPKPKPPANVQTAKTALQRLTGNSELRDFSFARPSKKSPVAGGTEDSRYLAIVFGMIMANRRSFAFPAVVDGNVTVAFNVDDGGDLTGMAIVHTSGYPQIDAEAVAAIRRAAPFPPPPPGSPHGLIATIDLGPPGAEAGRRGP